MTNIRFSTDDIDAEVERRQQEIQELLNVKRVLLARASTVADAPTVNAGATDNRIARGGPSRRTTTVHEGITTAIVAVLNPDKRLHRDDIKESIKAMGVHVSGDTDEKQVMTVGSYLSRDDRFKSLGKGMWMLAKAYADTAVHPPSDDDNDAGYNGRQ